MATTIDLSNASVSATGWSDTVAGFTLSSDKKTLTKAGVGTFTPTGTQGKATFTASSALKGDVSFTESAKVSLTGLDFSATKGGIKYTADPNDDTIILGSGKDVLTVKEAHAVSVKGFDAANDAISVAASGNDKLANTGIFTSGTASVVVATDSNDLYKVRTSLDAGTTQYWTLANMSTRKAIDASGVKETLVLDAQSATDVAITLGKGDATVSMVSGTVASGSGNDAIDASGKLTLSIGKNDGTDTIKNNIKKDDTIIFENGTLNQIGIDKTNAAVTFGNTKVKGLDTATSMFSAQFGTDGTAGKLQWAAAGQTLQADTDTVYFVGGDNTTTLQAAKGEVNYDLGDATKFQNIKYVTLQADTKGSFTLGNGNLGGDTIDGSAVTGSIAVTLGDGADVVSLGSANGRDTIKTAAAAGANKIANFQTGFDDTDDVIVLSDINSIDNLDVASANVITLDKDNATASSISLTSAVASDGILVQFAGSEAPTKVAADLNADDTIKTALADVYVGSSKGNTLLSLSGAAADATAGTFLNFADTKTYKNLSKFNLSHLEGQQIVVGTANADKITLGGADANTAVWGGGASADEITLNGDADRTSTSHVWFSASDGNDTVTNFKTSDDVFFWGASSISDIAKNYKFTKDSSGVTITNKSDARDQLKLSGYSDKTVKILGSDYLLKATTDAERAAATTKVTFADNSGAFATDSSIYIGTSTDAAVTVGKGEIDDKTKVVAIDMNGDDTGFDNRLYNVKTFDASNSYAQYVMIGSGESTLRGGHTANIYWGGGKDSQTFVGNADATDYFWFGSGDGNDYANKVDSKDVVYLYNVNSIDDVKIVTAEDTANIVLNTENSLSISDGVAAIKGGLTFMLGDDQKTAYTYDVNAQQFVKKA